MRCVGYHYPIKLAIKINTLSHCIHHVTTSNHDDNNLIQPNNLSNNCTTLLVVLTYLQPNFNVVPLHSNPISKAIHVTHTTFHSPNLLVSYCFPFLQCRLISQAFLSSTLDILVNVMHASSLSIPHHSYIYLALFLVLSILLALLYRLQSLSLIMSYEFPRFLLATQTLIIILPSC